MVSNVNEKNGSVELDIIFKSEGPKRLLAQFAPIEKKGGLIYGQYQKSCE